jgi:hypothetical protein
VERVTRKAALLEELTREAIERGVKIPTPKTFDKYGWTLLDWLQTLAEQDWRCPICDKAPPSGKYVTDHEHVRGWAAMPDEQRRLYVRGLTCWTCNRYLLARSISIETAERVALYLRRYAARRP